MALSFGKTATSHIDMLAFDVIFPFDMEAASNGSVTDKIFLIYAIQRLIFHFTWSHP